MDKCLLFESAVTLTFSFVPTSGMVSWDLPQKESVKTLRSLVLNFESKAPNKSSSRSSETHVALTFDLTSSKSHGRRKNL